MTAWNWFLILVATGAGLVFISLGLIVAVALLLMFRGWAMPEPPAVRKDDAKTSRS